VAKESSVGKIKRFLYTPENDELEFTIVVTDQKFKKKLLRDFSLRGDLQIDESGKVYFWEEKNADL